MQIYSFIIVKLLHCKQFEMYVKCMFYESFNSKTHDFYKSKMMKLFNRLENVWSLLRKLTLVKEVFLKMQKIWGK